MKRSIKVLVTLLIFLVHTAQSSELFDEVPILQLQSGHYLLEVSLNDSKLNFILDTGATGSVIDNMKSKELNLKKLNQKVSGEAAGEANIETGLVKIGSLKIGGHDAQLSEMFAQDLSLFKGLHTQAIHGILGQEVIKQLNLVIDLTKDKILIPLTPPKLPVSEHFKALEKIALNAHPSGLYTIKARMNDEIVRFVLDTGAPQIIIDKSFASKHFPNDLSRLKGQYSIGSNGEKNPISILQSKEVKLGDNLLGSQHLVDDLANVLEILKDENQPEVAGVIGLSDLKRLNAKIDIKNGKVYF